MRLLILGFIVVIIIIIYCLHIKESFHHDVIEKLIEIFFNKIDIEEYTINTVQKLNDELYIIIVNTIIDDQPIQIHFSLISSVKFDHLIIHHTVSKINLIPKWKDKLMIHQIIKILK